MPLRSRLRPARRLLTTVFVACGVIALASPAAAQYGGTVDLFVDPTRVEIDGVFGYFGSSCPAGSTVTITIDGFPDTLDTALAFDDSSFAGSGVDLPNGVIAGQSYTVRASCAGSSATVTLQAVCNGGTDPVGGECPDGRTIGGGDPTDPSTTTTTPGGNGTGGTGGTGSDLAVTGASFAEQAAQIGVTLVALGAIFVLFAAKRRERETA